MNQNILAYVIYLAIVMFIIFVVGHLFYKNGRIFILNLFHGDVAKTDYLNKVLLVAYYLFNTGYAFLKLRFWIRVENMEMLWSSLASNIGLLVLILAATHYFNMALVYYLSEKKTIISHS